MKQSCRAYSNHADKCFEKIKQLNEESDQNKYFTEHRNKSTSLFQFSTVNFYRSINFYYFLMTLPMHNVYYHRPHFIQINGLLQKRQKMCKIQASRISSCKSQDQPKFKKKEKCIKSECLFKVNKKFATSIHLANTKMLALQTDLIHIQEIANEFNLVSSIDYSDKVFRLKEIEEKIRKIERILCDMSAMVNKETKENRKIAKLLKCLGDLRQQMDAFGTAQNRLKCIESTLNKLKLFHDLHRADFVREKKELHIELEQTFHEYKKQLVAEVHRDTQRRTGAYSITNLILIALISFSIFNKQFRMF